jgi:hypothetical protein
MLSVFQSIEWSWLGQVLKNSPWAFAVIESIHLLALATIGGAVLVVDMRLLGLGLKRQSVTDVARDAQPVLVWSLAVMLLTGVALFISEAVKCYYSTPFWVKMTSLALAMLFTFTVKRRVTLTGNATAGQATLRLVALVSLALWFGVGAGGRWIGFSG